MKFSTGAPAARRSRSMSLATSAVLSWVQHRAAVPGALRAEGGPRPLPDRDLPRGGRVQYAAERGEQLVLRGEVGEAPQRSAAPEAARVEVDDVEPGLSSSRPGAGSPAAPARWRTGIRGNRKPSSAPE